MSTTPVLYVVVCGAAPASEVGELVTIAQDGGWRVQLLATTAGREFINVDSLESQTGRQVRSAYRTADQPRQPVAPADAIVVAPATFNTINKLAAGVADNYALGLLAECIGLGVPVIIVPFINSALARRAPLQAAVSSLRSEGVSVLLGSEGFDPHPPGVAGPAIRAFPWRRIFAEAVGAVKGGGAARLEPASLDEPE